MPTAAAMQGAYIPQYPAVPSSSVSVEVGALFLCSEARTHQGQISVLLSFLVLLTFSLVGVRTAGGRLHWRLASLLSSV